MAARHKGKAFAFGGKSVTTITHTNTTNSQAIKAVIEEVSPVVTADKLEYRDGNNDVDGLTFTNQRTTLSITFYVSEADISTSETNDERAMAPGDTLTFDDTSFPEIDDGNHTFIVDEITKARRFGQTRQITLTMTEYANDVSTDVTL